MNARYLWDSMKRFHRMRHFTWICVCVCVCAALCSRNIDECYKIDSFGTNFAPCKQYFCVQHEWNDWKIWAQQKLTHRPNVQSQCAAFLVAQRYENIRFSLLLVFELCKIRKIVCVCVCVCIFALMCKILFHIAWNICLGIWP